MEICDGLGNCCNTGGQGLDNPGTADRQLGQIDVYTDEALLGTCVEVRIQLQLFVTFCSFITIRFVYFQGNLVGTPATAKVTMSGPLKDDSNEIVAYDFTWI